LQAGLLNIIGPTGYGFYFRGNWTSIAVSAGNGLKQYAFVATAGVKLDTPRGLLPMPLPPSGYVLITTAPSGTASFGPIASTKIFTGLQFLDDLASFYFPPTFAATVLIDNGTTGLQVTQGQQLGIAPGSTINASVDPNAPSTRRSRTSTSTRPAASTRPIHQSTLAHCCRFSRARGSGYRLMV
jgi:hypothetical protein